MRHLPDLNQKGNRWVYLFIACRPAAVLMVMMAVSGTSLLRYLPVSSDWNDEVFYFKQAEGIAAYGMPKGYFGYSLAHAEIGTIGAWNPLILYIDALFYLLLGRSVYSIYLGNLILLMASFGFLCGKRRLTYRRSLQMLIPIASMAVIRYAYSAMPETLFSAGILVLFAILPDAEDREIVPATVLLLLLGFMRPYILLLLFLIYHGPKSSRNSWGKGILLVLAGAAAYFLVTKYFCAPNADGPSAAIQTLLSFFQNGFFSGMVQNLKYFASRVLSRLIWSLSNAVHLEARTEVYGASMVYLLYDVTWILLLARVIARHRAGEQEIHENLLLIAAAVMFLLAAWLDPNPTAGNRHLTPVMLMMWLILMEPLKPAAESFHPLPILAVMILVSNLLILRDSFYRWSSADSSAYLKSSRLSSLQLTAEPADNTMVFEYGSDNELFRSLYALTPGTGINLCFADQINPAEIPYRYAMIAAGSENAAAFRSQAGWTVLDSNDKYVLFEKQ